MADKKRLHWETVTPLLKEVLGLLMSEKIFIPFRLVGGTNLSLRYVHRLSVDIDLFPMRNTETSTIAYSKSSCVSTSPCTNVTTRLPSSGSVAGTTSANQSTNTSNSI